MDGVTGVFGTDFSVGTGQDGSIVDEGDAMALAIGLQAGVKGLHLLEGIGDFRPPAKFIGRKEGADNRANAVVPGQVNHTEDIGIGKLLYVRISHILGDVIDTPQKNEGRSMDIKDILPETEQHLGRFFSADTPADKTGFGKEIRALGSPAVGDGISIQYNTGAVASSLKRLIGSGITVQVGNILSLGAHAKQHGKKEEDTFHNSQISSNITIFSYFWNMKYVMNASTDPHWNMAHDEFLLDGLREQVFCLWQNRPSVIIGLNQSPYAEVDLKYLESRGIVLARRVTGGGAVYHDLGNLNYSIAGPASQMENLYGLMAETLRSLGVAAERSGRNDILVEGRKCSGYAKRLNKDRMIIHGTLMWDVNLDTLTKALSVPGSKLQAAGIASVRSRVANLKEYLPQFSDIKAFQGALQEKLADGSPEILLTQEQISSINQMADSKFSTWEWNFGRSPSATFAASRKFSCGTVQVRYTLRHGVFESLHFSGDFIGNRPAEQLAASLIGQKPEALRNRPVSDFFDGIGPEELASLF